MIIVNKLCLVKTRSLAKKACDKNLVKVNGVVAKSSGKIKEGDEIEFTIFGNYTKVRLNEIPAGNISKVQAPEYYEILDRKIRVD